MTPFRKFEVSEQNASSSVPETILDNDMTLYVQSHGKLVEIVCICSTAEEANAIMADAPELGVITEDNHGLIYLANMKDLGKPRS